MDGDRRAGGREPRADPSRASAHSAAAYAGLGVQFVAAILLFVFVGNWLDKRLDTSPWLLILGAFVGAAGGFYNMYRRLMTGGQKPRGR